MLQVVKAYVEPNPVNVGFFGCIGIVFVSNCSAQLVKQTWRVLGFSYAVHKYSIFLSRPVVQRSHSVGVAPGVMFDKTSYVICEG